jgi:glycerophosphoryl diester phosphodiesterase
MLMIGHRGARFEAPENTVPGFRYALGLGLQAMEFDIRMTKDEQLVVIHDATVDRTTDGEGEVASLTLAELQALDARATFPDWPEPCHVPTFAEVLDVVGHLPELLVEIKGDAPERLDAIVPKVIAEIRARGIAPQVTITSFEPYALDLARRESPEIRRGYIGRWDAPDFLETAVRLDCAQIDANHTTADRGLVAKARSLRMRVVGWPTNSQDDLESVRTLEPALFCTDRPTLLATLAAPSPG